MTDAGRQHQEIDKLNATLADAFGVQNRGEHPVGRQPRSEAVRAIVLEFVVASPHSSCDARRIRPRGCLEP
jgi:hypothetical protein